MLYSHAWVTALTLDRNETLQTVSYCRAGVESRHFLLIRRLKRNLKIKAKELFLIKQTPRYPELLIGSFCCLCHKLETHRDVKKLWLSLLGWNPAHEPSNLLFSWCECVCARVSVCARVYVCACVCACVQAWKGTHGRGSRTPWFKTLGAQVAKTQTSLEILTFPFLLFF